MTVYMEPRESAFYWFGDEEEQILSVLANRYVGANPPIPFAMRAFSKSGILQNASGLYEMDLNARMPDAQDGDYGYVYGLVWSDDERSLDGLLEPMSPARLYVNGGLAYRSTAVDELKADAQAVIPLLLRKGWNTLLIEVRKNQAGFGCRFGAEEAKVRILQVLAPFANRSGSAGWVYAGPFQEPRFGGELAEPDFRANEENSRAAWLPRTHWSEEEAAGPNFERVFAGQGDTSAAGYGWSTVVIPYGSRKLVLEGKAYGPATIWLNGKIVVELKEAGSYVTKVPAEAGTGQLVVRSVGSKQGWGFELRASVANGSVPVELKLPLPVQGHDGAWLLAGPLDAAVTLTPAELCTTSALFPAADMVDSSIGRLMRRIRAYVLITRTRCSATNGRQDQPRILAAGIIR